jgi:hypothetical protein
MQSWREPFAVCSLEVRSKFLRDLALRLLLGDLLVSRSTFSVVNYRTSQLFYIYNAHTGALVMPPHLAFLGVRDHPDHPYHIGELIALTERCGIGTDMDFIEVHWERGDSTKIKRLEEPIKAFLEGDISYRAKLLRRIAQDDPEWAREAAYFLVLYFAF